MVRSVYFRLLINIAFITRPEGTIVLESNNNTSSEFDDGILTPFTEEWLANSTVSLLNKHDIGQSDLQTSTVTEETFRSANDILLADSYFYNYNVTSNAFVDRRGNKVFCSKLTLLEVKLILVIDNFDEYIVCIRKSS